MRSKRIIHFYKLFISLTMLLTGIANSAFAQIAGGFDTITVIKNNATLKLPWTGGLNACSFSEIDLNNDSKNDLVAFDKVNTFSYGIFRCFINDGTSGQIKYSYTPNYNSQFPYVQQWACFHDYNNDGKADLFTYTLGGIKVYKNTSATSLSFTLAKSILMSNSTPTSSATYNPIYSSPISLPGFSDVDNDGDLDIIVFNATGFQLEYHKNLSKELYSHSDSLVFELNETTWGDFTESNCAVTLNQFRGEQLLHAGSCLLPFDRDGDGDKDLLLGDIGCDQMVYLENTGTPMAAHIGDTTKLYPNYPQKASTQVIRLNSFPAAHLADVNNDGKKDLLISPNMTSGENANSVWVYQNTGTASASYFQFQKNNFLQDEMIEMGEGAYPVAIDVDADGLKDLVVGNMGYYQNGILKTKLSLYKNIGTTSQPSYSFITNDYANISSFATTNTLVGIVPTFGDLDGDGDKDMVMADFYGKLHYAENTAGTGNSFNFTILTANAFSITTPQPVPYPQLIDVDRDNLLDLIVGLRNGKLAYYKNVGTSSSPSFSLITAAFGNVNVKGPASLYSVDGSCAPFMYDEGGTYKLLCGSISGHIYLYDNIDGNLSGNFNVLDTMVNATNAGPRSTLSFEDVNNDGKRDLFVGNQAGGLHFYNSKKPVGIEKKFKNDEESFSVFPNPAKDHLLVRLSSKTDSLIVYLYNSVGQLIYSTPVKDTLFSIQTEHLSAGIYFIRTGNADHLSAAKKIVIIK
jgi:hypothetical protein